MRMETAVETTWHDHGMRIVIPPGEPVEVTPLEQVPKPDRWELADGLRAHTKLGEDFTPIKIRDWWALINRTWLRPLTPKPAPEKRPAAEKRKTTSLF